MPRTAAQSPLRTEGIPIIKTVPAAGDLRPSRGGCRASRENHSEKSEAAQWLKASEARN